VVETAASSLGQIMGEEGASRRQREFDHRPGAGNGLVAAVRLDQATRCLDAAVEPVAIAIGRVPRRAAAQELNQRVRLTEAAFDPADALQLERAQATIDTPADRASPLLPFRQGCGKQGQRLVSVLQPSVDLQPEFEGGFGRQHLVVELDALAPRGRAGDAVDAHAIANLHRGRCI
jgi:hypothetical protein